MNIYFGIDFGTTNTVVSIAGKVDKVIDSFSVPTILYIPYNEKGIDEVFIGEEAVTQYRVDGKGRYIHSIKRSLIDTSFEYTTINNVKITLEDLIVLFLKELKKKIYNRWGIEPEKMALGKPVKFSAKKEENELANLRLLKGFSMAGFKSILQLEEPIAAAYGINSQSSISQSSVLIADIGGGTSDFTSINVDTSKEGISRFEVVGIDGIDVGGDNFDENIMLKEIAPYLGLNETYKSFNKKLELPIHLFTDICKWNLIYRYDTVKFKEEIKDYLFGSSDPKKIKRLSKVYFNRLSSAILAEVKKTKHTLTNKYMSHIDLDKLELDVIHTLKKDNLPGIFTRSLKKIEKVLVGITLKNKRSFKKVFVTGGSSKLPQVRSLISNICNSSEVEFDSNYYSSISNGLALYCKYTYENSSNSG